MSNSNSPTSPSGAPRGAGTRRRRPLHPGEVPLDTVTPTRGCCCSWPSTDEKVAAEMDRLHAEHGIVPHPQPFKRREEHLLEGDGPYPVYLNVYHLVSVGTNRKLKKIGMGIFHSGVQLHGEEWSFGAPATPEETCGAFMVPPMEANGELHAHLFLGTTTMTKEQFKTVERRFMTEWPAADYHVLNRNCNHFCYELCRMISTTQPIVMPTWVNRISSWADCVVPRSLATWAVSKATQQEPPKAPARDPSNNTGSDVRFAARLECRQDKVAMHYQVQEVMAATLRTPTAAGGDDLPPVVEASSPSSPGKRKPEDARNRRTTPPPPGSSSPPPPPGTSRTPGGGRRSPLPSSAAAPPKPGTAGSSKPRQGSGPATTSRSTPTRTRTTAATGASPSSHVDPKDMHNLGLIPSPEAPQRASRAETRVTFAPNSARAGDSAAAPSPAAAGTAADDKAKPADAEGGCGRAGTAGGAPYVSPFLAPHDISPTKSELAAAQAFFVATPASQQAGGGMTHSRDSSLDIGGDAEAKLDEADSGSAHTASSPNPPTLAATRRGGGGGGYEDDDQTVDYNTLTGGGAAAPLDGGDVTEPQSNAPTAAQALSGAAPSAAMMSGTGIGDTSMTAGITENNAFNRPSNVGDDNTFSATDPLDRSEAMALSSTARPRHLSGSARDVPSPTQGGDGDDVLTFDASPPGDALAATPPVHSSTPPLQAVGSAATRAPLRDDQQARRSDAAAGGVRMSQVDISVNDDGLVPTMDDV